MSSQNNDSRFDVRNIERYLQSGQVSKEEYQAWLDSLEDTADDTLVARTRFVHRAFNPGDHVEDASEED